MVVIEGVLAGISIATEAQGLWKVVEELSTFSGVDEDGMTLDLMRSQLLPLGARAGRRAGANHGGARQEEEAPDA